MYPGQYIIFSINMVNDHSYSKLVSECFIKPKFDIEKPRLQPHYLSPSGLNLLSISYMQKGLLFNKPNPPTYDVTQLTKKLKIALSLALVHFYPLAGQLATDKYEDEHKCCIYVDCNKGPGARFIHAELGITVSDISIASLPVIWSLFDNGDRGAVNHDGHSRSLLSVQVTELVDGVFIGFTMNHSIADATTLWHFVNTLSEIYLSDDDVGENNTIHTISRVPVYWSHQEGVDHIIKLPFLNPDEFITRVDSSDDHLNNLRTKSFQFSAASVALLKSIANAEYCGADETLNISSFQALIGLVWMSITRARCLPPDAETSCSLVVNGRPRLNPPLSQDCFGNFVMMAQGRSKAGELLANGLGSAALLLYQAVEAQDDKAIRSALEAPVVPQHPGLPPSIYGYHPIEVGGSPRFDMYGPEFGLGRAVAVQPGFTNKPDGKVTANPGCGGAGSVELEISLTAETMAKLVSDDKFMSYALS